jgi:S-formylglutathione hydrolase
MNGVWSLVSIGNKPADVYDPPGGRPRFGILYLHPFGLETLADNAAFTTLFDELRLACICPHAGRSWWADRICAEFDPRITPERHLLDTVVPCFQTRWGLEPPGIGLLGISMGGQGALRLAFKHPQRFGALAGISSALDYHELYGQGLALDEMYDSKEQCRQDTALLHVHPSHFPPHIFFCIDPEDREWYRGNDRLHEKLAALGIEHTCDLATRAGGHSWLYFNAVADRAVRFVNAGLEQQSRRLL